MLLLWVRLEFLDDLSLDLFVSLLVQFLQRLCASLWRRQKKDLQEDAQLRLVSLTRRLEISCVFHGIVRALLTDLALL